MKMSPPDRRKSVRELALEIGIRVLLFGVFVWIRQSFVNFRNVVHLEWFIRSVIFSSCFMMIRVPVDPESVPGGRGTL
ncbi:hypothetical protein QTP86_029984 [Hemibagrus guttatus]|nr:hypothetical protein QTP86_029984 [Hemibagrus guttatus]